MPRSKNTISRDSVFRRTSEVSPTQGITDEQANHQTAVWLGDEEIQWLDTQRQVIRKGGWRAITRSALIRAIIRAAMEQPTDLSGVSGEAELAQRLRSST